MPQYRPPRRGRRPYTLGPVAGLVIIIVMLILSNRMNLLGGSSPEGVPSVPLPANRDSAGPLAVYYLDVGQGDSQLIRIPGEGGYFNMLIDTGEYKYADGLTAYLTDLGVERIDALVCSHPHTDHMGCMARIIQRFEIGGLYMPLLPEDKTPTTTAYEKLLDAAAEKGLVINQLHEDAAIESPAGSLFQVMSPTVDADWDGANNYSAVMRLVYGETSFLFTGDAEEESEEIILQDGYLLESDVLKCGHHGSSTSTSDTFLAKVHPTFAVISCEAENSYGHPHRETVEKLEAAAVEIYRTDKDGTILAESDGETVTFTTGLKSVEEKAG